MVFTTAGGWGVLAADACAAAGLELVPLPDDLRRAIDGLVPPRWSRNNPVDLAGGETRDTVPQVLDLLCAHPDVDAVIHLGLGIQAAQAHAFRSGPSTRATASTASSSSTSARTAATPTPRARPPSGHGKPVLSATELVYTDRAYGNAGPLGVREEGRRLLPERPPGGGRRCGRSATTRSSGAGSHRAPSGKAARGSPASGDSARLRLAARRALSRAACYSSRER